VLLSREGYTTAVSPSLKSLLPDPLRRVTAPVRHALRDRLANAVASARILWRIRLRKAVLDDLAPFEKRIHSQNGEDGIIEAIFARVGITNRVFVEIGAEDGQVCNTRRLREAGWDGLQVDRRDPPAPMVEREFVTAENIEALFERHRVPHAFDLLSIDVDGNDYWLWKALTRWRPRVVVIEYNATVGPTEPRVVPYAADFENDGSDYYGAGLAALASLGAAKGYALVGCDSNGVNAFFVEQALAAGRFRESPPQRLYRPIAAHYAPHRSAGGSWLRL
jgi:hypothetical protein